MLRTLSLTQRSTLIALCCFGSVGLGILTANTQSQGSTTKRGDRKHQFPYKSASRNAPSSSNNIIQTIPSTTILTPRDDDRCYKVILENVLEGGGEDSNKLQLGTSVLTYRPPSHSQQSDLRQLKREVASVNEADKVTFQSREFMGSVKHLFIRWYDSSDDTLAQEVLEETNIGALFDMIANRGYKDRMVIVYERLPTKVQ